MHFKDRKFFSKDKDSFVVENAIKELTKYLTNGKKITRLELMIEGDSND